MNINNNFTIDMVLWISLNYEYFINGMDNDKENGKSNCNCHKSFEFFECF